jgi:hypothetical protein
VIIQLLLFIKPINLKSTIYDFSSYSKILFFSIIDNLNIIKIPMKYFFKALIFVFLFFSKSSVNASECSVTNTHIVSIIDYSDGVVYINTDKINNCGCAINNRLGFWRSTTDPNQQKTWIAMSLTAITTNQVVTLYGDTTNCATIGNTATLTGIGFGPQ